MNEMMPFRTTLRFFGALCTCAMLASMPSCSSTARTGEDRTNFVSPRAAVDAVVAALRADDLEKLSAALGPDADAILHSGDDVADKAARKQFIAEYDTKHAIVMKDRDTAVIEVGHEAWPFPIPIVRVKEAWFFDTEEGEEELIDRRIGRNELSAIQACLAFVDAQEEYARSDWDGDGIFEYAQRFRSTPGKKDGLYWATAEGEAISPLGELAAEAAAEGYNPGRNRDDQRPYHGYYFRILNCQASNAPGGAYDYMAGDSMIGGFAMVAWPARYEDSGIMSFLVSHHGVVYQKDLGEGSERAAKSKSAFDPDDTWTVAGKR